MLLNFCQALLPTLAAPTGPAERELVCWPGAAGGPAWRLSAAELRGQLVVAQAALARQGVRPGQSVLVLLPLTPALLLTLLALLSLGAVPVLPAAGTSALALARLVRRADLPAAVVGARVARRWGWLARLLGRRLLALPSAAAGAGAAAAVPPTAWQPRLVPAAQPALVSFSSGTTGRGRPHAVRRSHAVLLAQHEALKIVFPPRTGQRDFPLFPNVLLHNLAAGTTTIVPALPWATGWAGFDPAELLSQIAAERVTTLTGNVFYFQKLLRHLHHQPATFPLVQALGVGGSPVPERLLHRLKAYFPAAGRYVIYGCSEAEPIAVRQVGPAPTDPRRGYAVGAVHPSLELLLAAPQPLWLPAAPGATPDGARGGGFDVGEILVRGPHVAPPAGAEWLATGDFGYLDEAGQLWLVGRRGAGGPVGGVWHYQVEHVARQAADGLALAAARPARNQLSFDLFVQGPVAAAPAIRAALAAAFGPALLGALHFRDRLPVDKRHFSKIRYDLLR